MLVLDPFDNQRAADVLRQPENRIERQVREVKLRLLIVRNRVWQERGTEEHERAVHHHVRRAELRPKVEALAEPLGGECAARRTLLERLPFVEGYGIETGLLIDTLRLIGTRHLAQVDLGVRNHRHRTLLQLSEQASEITALVLQRAGLDVPDPLPPLLDADGVSHPVEISERPPLVEVAAYRDRSKATA